MIQPEGADPVVVDSHNTAVAALLSNTIQRLIDDKAEIVHVRWINRPPYERPEDYGFLITAERIK